MIDAVIALLVLILAVAIEAGFIALLAWGAAAVLGLAFWPVFAVGYLAFVFIRFAVSNS